MLNSILISKNGYPKVDSTFLATFIVLIIFGILMVYDASVVYSDAVFGGKYRFLFLQTGWVFIGIVGMFFLSKIDLDIIKKYSPYAFIFTILLLAFIILPTWFSPQVYGARRWFVLNPSPLPAFPIIGRLSFQPSELAKLTSIVFLSALLSSRKIKKQGKSHALFLFSIVFILVCGLVAIEPDFTTSFVLAVTLIFVYFFSGAPMYFLVPGTTILGASALFYALSSEYRKLRVQALFDLDALDKSGAGYHIRQIMIALGSGGVFGLGFGKSRQKYAYLPEVTADSIFAVIGEEFGFIGATLLVLLFVFLISRGIKISMTAEDQFSKLLSAGVIMWIAVQSLINLGAMVRLLPLTGIPLPFISYGGSSTIFVMWGLGLVLNVSRNSKLK